MPPQSAPARNTLNFLRGRRRVLAFALAASVVGTIMTHDLPASAGALPTPEPHLFGEQSLSVSAATASPAPVTRDNFGVTIFDLVQWPLDPSTKISSYFGYRSCAGCTRDHHGVDYNPGAGTPIEVISDGVVVEVGNPSGALGVYAVVEHVIDGRTVRSVYAHMTSGSLRVSVGDEVTRGQVVGTVGDTGLSTGPHLHFGILLGDDTPIEPLAWMRAHVNAAWTD